MVVSEEPVPLRTRDVLEKGLRFVGCSRSTPEDLARALRLLERPEVRARVDRLRAERKFGRRDIREAFEFASRREVWGKVVIDLSDAA